MANQAMDAFLADYYGTDAAVKTAAAREEDVEKQASVDLFMKLAADQNIDLSKMSPAQVNELYGNWVKAASEPPPFGKKEDGKDGEKEEEAKKHEEAKKEHEEKKAQAEKVAEADFLGRVMAHAYCQEMRKIAASAGEPTAQDAAAAAAAAVEATKVAAMPDALKKGLEHVKSHASGAAKAIGGAAHKAHEHVSGAAHSAMEHASGAAHKAHEVGKAHPGATHGAAAAAGVAGGAGAMHAIHHHGEHKEGSAIDALAAEQAVKIAHAEGYDAEEAGRKIAAIFELGLAKPSEKTASAPDYAAAVGIRALELLEVAGYPVTWSE
jgi:hypothetical protein